MYLYMYVYAYVYIIIYICIYIYMDAPVCASLLTHNTVSLQSIRDDVQGRSSSPPWNAAVLWTASQSAADLMQEKSETSSMT